MSEQSIQIKRGKEGYNLSKKGRILYSLTNLPNIILSGIFGLTYVNYFWDDLQLQQTLFVIGQVIYAFVNSLNDFYFGRITDKTNVKKWGSRRLIYIKWGGVLWALVFFLTWFPWSYSNQIIIFLQFIICICAFDMMLSLVWLVWIALMPELTESNDERNKMALNNQIFLIIGAFPVLLAFLIYASGLLTFQIFAGICAIICGVCYYYIGSTLKERPALYINQDSVPLLKALKEVLKTRSYISMTLFRVFNQLNLALGLSFMFAYIYILSVDFTMASFFYYLIITFVALLGYLIYKKLSMNKDMRTLILWGRVIQISINLVGFFIILLPGVDFLVWIFLTINSIVSGFMLFDYPVMMLVTDEDEILNNERREGLILGTNAFFNKIAESIGPIVGTSILLLFGFIRDQPTQTPFALIGIKFLLLVVPSIINLAGLISIYFFPLHGKALEELHKKILILHKEKNELYKSQISNNS
ncbi:MAG: MFS transporter [Candidatus Hermodarchaeota archaeon]